MCLAYLAFDLSSKRPMKTMQSFVLDRVGSLHSSARYGTGSYDIRDVLYCRSAKSVDAAGNEQTREEDAQARG